MKKIIKLTESDLTRLVKQILKEQLGGTLGLSRVSNLSKVGKSTKGSKGGKIRTPEDSPDAEAPCEYEVVENVILTCQSNSSYTSTPMSEIYTKKLYDVMKGSSWSKDQLYVTLQSIPNDGTTFCRVARNFKNSVKKFDKSNEDGLWEWISNEWQVDYKKIRDIIKPKISFKMKNYCDDGNNTTSNFT